MNRHLTKQREKNPLFCPFGLQYFIENLFTGEYGKNAGNPNGLLKLFTILALKFSFNICVRTCAPRFNCFWLTFPATEPLQPALAFTGTADF